MINLLLLGYLPLGRMRATTQPSLGAACGQLVLVACIDNLVKGAAGQAIQNFNVAVGLDEEVGLN